MPVHDHLHRRHARAAFAWPDAKALASALAEPFPGANPFAEAEPKPTQTLVSVVYVTAKPTFDGPIGGYKTMGQDEDDEAPKQTAQEPKTTAAPKPTQKADDEEKESKKPQVTADTNEGNGKVSVKATGGDTSSALPTAITAPKTTLSTSLAVLVATGSVTGTDSGLRSSATVASSEASSTAQPTAEGMSTGGKAGLAIGILLLIGAVLAIILVIFKKKKAAKDRADDEKNDIYAAGAGRAASIRTTATAPRLSLRPVTQFLPGFGEKRQSRGNLLNTVAEPVQTASNDQNRSNPFGSHAESIDATNARGPTPVEVPVQSTLAPVAAVTAVAAGAGAIGLARGASRRGNGPNPIDYTTRGVPHLGPPSPSGTEFSVTSDSASTPTPTGSGAAIVAAGGPPNTVVHRVQLDFKPSMEDELELRAGQLIRLLHEYDDGWALCIRLDRSQQGVVPRTCLSTRPVKPRPQQGPPQGQRGPGQMRPMSPAGGPPRGQPGMNHGRPSSPGGRNSPGPQYNGQRQGTPQGQGQIRSQSPSQQSRRNSPPSRSPMNPGAEGTGYPQMGSSPPHNGPVGRKPVPGQAL